jgi:outer membrane immunogenic protein
MKRLVCAVALIFFAGSSAATAADFGAPPPPPVYAAPPPPPIYPIYQTYPSFSGIYVGINGGGAFGNSNWTDPFFGNTGNFDFSGGLFGGTVGANYQTGPWVFGVEGDWDWTNLSGTTFNGSCAFVGCTTQSNWLATVRGRAGWAPWNQVLLYGTAGAAFANVEAAAGAFPFMSSTQVGWTAGVGLEYAFTRNWSAKAEYLFVDLGNASCGFANCGDTNTTVSLNENIIRAGVNFKFGSGWW